VNDCKRASDTISYSPGIPQKERVHFNVQSLVARLLPNGCAEYTVSFNSQPVWHDAAISVTQESDCVIWVPWRGKTVLLLFLSGLKLASGCFSTSYQNYFLLSKVWFIWAVSWTAQNAESHCSHMCIASWWQNTSVFMHFVINVDKSTMDVLFILLDVAKTKRFSQELIWKY